MLSARALSCHRGTRLLLADVSLSAGAGEAVWLLGPNGVGKSTLLRVLAGLQAPLAGSISIDAPFFYLGAELGFDGALSLEDNLKWFAGLHGADQNHIQNVVEKTSLTHCLKLPFHSLSKGQQQRAALARLLIAPRPLWLLDEPLAHLDAAGQQLAIGLMADHLRAGGAIIAATHDVPDLAGSRTVQLESAA